MRVGEANGVVTTGTERPQCFASLVDFSLFIDPVEERRPLSVRRSGITRVGGRIACAWDFDNDSRDVLLRPAFDPDGELGSVAVEAGEDYDKGYGAALGRARWQVVVEW
jgi:hypothetical protein